MTYRIALIVATPERTETFEAEGVPLSAMKAQIRKMVAEYRIAPTATLHVEQENPRKLYFRNLLSSVPSLVE